jgi:hypothetical protein
VLRSDPASADCRSEGCSRTGSPNPFSTFLSDGWSPPPKKRGALPTLCSLLIVPVYIFSLSPTLLCNPPVLYDYNTLLDIFPSPPRHPSLLDTRLSSTPIPPRHPFLLTTTFWSRLAGLKSVQDPLSWPRDNTLQKPLRRTSNA